jgi:hypothetical protein
LRANRQLFEESRALGCTLYAFAALKLSRSDWRHHYGHGFDELTRAKHGYDFEQRARVGPDLFQTQIPDKNLT